MNTDLSHFIAGALINLVTAVIIVRFIYYPWTQNRSFVFTFISFNTTIYFVMSLLTSIELSIGVGFGLFAIFSVIRYRTEEMPIREMTYLFIIIALPIMNSVPDAGNEYAKVAIANVTIVVLLYILEREWGFRFQLRKRITYDRIELIPPARRAELIADLQARTGLPVSRVDVGRLDFVRDIADVTIYYEWTDPLPEARRHGLDTEFQPAGRHLLD